MVNGIVGVMDKAVMVGDCAIILIVGFVVLMMKLVRLLIARLDYQLKNAALLR